MRQNRSGALTVLDTQSKPNCTDNKCFVPVAPIVKKPMEVEVDTLIWPDDPITINKPVVNEPPEYLTRKRHGPMVVFIDR